jgi:membrane-bound lytic murein transglycosylase D
MPSKRFWKFLAAALILVGTATGVFFYGLSLAPFENQSPTESASDLPNSMSNVVAPTARLTEDEKREGVAWSAPDFSSQTDALGWNEIAFSVPKGMEARVEFWKQIYSKYTTDQGVLHDPVTLEVYDTLKFEPLREGESLSANARARQKLVDRRRDEINDRLLALQARLDALRAGERTTPFDTAPPPALRDPDLHGEDLRFWKLFEANNDPSKFKKAAARIRFQLGQRDRVLLGIFYSGRYLSAMEKIFREEGLPIELTRLPFVESSFNTKARSKVGASGVWQFMRKTARPYLKITADVDERNDPLTATIAAARLMRSNYSMLHSWPLAVTAWNHGPSGVRNISQKLSTDDIAQITNTYSSRTFGFASQNFYACFLAILDIEAHAKKYFAKPVWQAPLESVEIKTRNFIAWPAVVKFFDGNESVAEDYNPHVTQHAHSSKPRIGPGVRLHVPPGAEIPKSFSKGK